MSQVIASLLLVPHLSVINHYAQGGGDAGWQNRETQDAQYGYLPMNHLAKAAPTDFLSPLCFGGRHGSHRLDHVAVQRVIH